MSKTTTLTRTSNESKSQHKELNAEAMTFYECAQSHYDSLDYIHAITTKVIQDGNVMLSKEHPRIQEAK